MPNVLDANGLRLNTYDEWLSIVTRGFQNIYGDDINLDSASPDGQLVNFLVQILVDQGDLIRNVYSSFDPDQAFGVTLDQRIGLNGIKRQAGQFSKTLVQVKISRSINLTGLDRATQDNPAFTVQDGRGTRWQLITSQLGKAPGTYDLAFQAAEQGRILAAPNSITTQSTIVPGVESVNNPAAQFETGIEEELDSTVKVRRQKSVALSSDGYQPSLESALKNLAGIAEAFVYENDTPATVGEIPANSIWVIVEGSASDADIANVIYRKKNAGCGTFGSKQFQIPRRNQPAFQVKWDVIQQEIVFLKYSVIPIDPLRVLNLAAIRSEILIAALRGAILDVNTVASLVRAIDSNALVVDAGFGNGRRQVIRLDTTPTSGTLELQYGSNSAVFAVGDLSASNFQTKLRTIQGLEQVTATISNTPQTAFIAVMAFPSNPAFGMIKIKSSTLNTIPKIVMENASPIIRQSSRKNRLLLSPVTIINNTITLSANDTSVSPRQTVNLTAAGGYGETRFLFVTNATQATLNAQTGVYVAGNQTGQDIIEARDQLGNQSNQITIIVR